MNFIGRIFKPIKLSYGITVCNESVELQELLKFIISEKDPLDEIIVLRDLSVENEDVTAVLNDYKGRILIRETALNGNFSAFKNQLLELASGDFMFQIDADELPKLSLLKGIKWFLRKKFRSDCILVPRINVVNGISHEYIKQCGWILDEKDRINFPDYQMRIFRLNGKINWKNKIHEELVGWKKKALLPIKNDDYCLWHIKDIKRQALQNDFYESLN